MEAKAKLKYLRIAPRKVRLVADMVRGQKVGKAKSLLQFTVNRSALPVLKLLNSAVVGAKEKMNWEESNMFISSITVDEGPKLKRWMPRARGSASPIQKKTSHITIALSELEKTELKVSKKKKSKIETKKVSSLSEIKEDFSKDKKTKTKPEAEIEKKKKITGNQPASKLFRRKSI